MADVNKLNGLKNVNLLSNKNAKVVATAITLFLSTVACSITLEPNNFNCCVIPGISVLALALYGKYTSEYSPKAKERKRAQDDESERICDEERRNRQ